MLVEVGAEGAPDFVFRLLQAFQNAPDGLADGADLLLLARLGAAHVLQRPGFDFSNHQLYCQLTGQNLRLGFDRERQWYAWLRAGFTLADLRPTVAYLQREIREGRRNVGALKLSNLLQPDRFEEDLNIRRVRLVPPPRPPAPLPAPLSPAQRELRRRQCLEQIRRIKESLR